MAIRPLYDRIIVQRSEEEKQTASGIVIPDTAREKPEQGEVIAIGSGRLMPNGTLLALQVKPGQRVLFSKYSGQTVTLDGEEYLVLKEEDVLGVIEPAQESGLKKAA
jgi:chaperonin GroES